MNCPYVMKKCSMCGEILHISKYNKDKTRTKGVYHRCKKCNKIYQIKYREDNKEDLKMKKKEYYENNKEKCKERNKKCHQEHKEERNAKSRQYYQEHKEETKEYQRKYYQENKDKVTKRNKQYRYSHKDEIRQYNKEHNIKNPQVKINSHNRRRANKDKTEDITKEQWYEMMMFFGWRCAYSNEYIGGATNKNRTIDHIIALDNDGEHVIWNLVPCYSTYNFQKKTKNLLEWYLEQPFFSIERLTKIYEWRIYAYEKWGKK